MNENTVLEMMLEERGTKFDPRFLDLFMANLSSVCEILSSPELSDEVSADSGLLEQKRHQNV